MSKISSYPHITNPELDDLLIGTDVANLESTKNFPISGLAQLINPYVEYVALVSQTGTSNPTSIVLRNTLSAIPTWTRTGVNTFDLTLTGAFMSNKTICSITNPTDDYTLVPSGTRISNDVCRFYFQEGVGGGTQINIEVKVYDWYS